MTHYEIEDLLASARVHLARYYPTGLYVGREADPAVDLELGGKLLRQQTTIGLAGSERAAAQLLNDWGLLETMCRKVYSEANPAADVGNEPLATLGVTADQQRHIDGRRSVLEAAAENYAPYHQTESGRAPAPHIPVAQDQLSVVSTHLEAFAAMRGAAVASAPSTPRKGGGSEAALDANQQKQVCELFIAKPNVSWLAREYKVDRKTIDKCLQKRGLKIRPVQK